MAPLEDIIRGTTVKGILSDALVKAIDVHWIGTLAIEVTYKATSVNYDFASLLALGKETA